MSDDNLPALISQNPMTITAAKRGTLPDASGLLPMSVMSQRLGKHAMQTAYTVLILLTLVGVSRLLARLIPLPLPLVQIAAGALLAWPTLGLHVALDPELFLFLFLPPLLFSDAGGCPSATSGATAARF